ncbi:MAG: YihY/virulence factor BrkB family protein [Tannerellaceae bacterium]|jgi:membrane protein|nr:YihY/virulence factor BrkB family protein [Tannerellaceae bacterium]
MHPSPPKNSFARFVRFISEDIWRITESEVSGIHHLLIRCIKTLILAVRSFLNDNLHTKASALTFNTLLAIVPLLAVILGIAKGFGYQDTVCRTLIDFFPQHAAPLAHAFDFVHNYLSLAQGGLFFGVGLLLLFYTVISLLASIEETFNAIWEIHKPRPLYRRITDYLVLCLILPALMTASSGLSLFFSSIGIYFSIAPYLISSLVFAALYIFLPNTHVKPLPGISAGILAGSAFQFFQFLYISGQVWVSRYNAIYGSFAALPLLLLWLQASWIICLFGASLAYASQNVEKFAFERDCKHISRRYKDFLTILLASLIVQRFDEGGKPYTADELSTRFRIPLRLTAQILFLLVQAGILLEVNDTADERLLRYLPAIDIHRLSIASLFERIDRYGSENFKIDTLQRFRPHWDAFLHFRQHSLQHGEQMLLKDLAHTKPFISTNLPTHTP